MLPLKRTLDSLKLSEKRLKLTPFTSFTSWEIFLKKSVKCPHLKLFLKLQKITKKLRLKVNVWNKCWLIRTMRYVRGQEIVFAEATTGE